MTQTIEQANSELRAAVQARLNGTYKPPVLAGCKPAEEAAAQVLRDTITSSCCEGGRIPTAAQVVERFNPPRQSITWMDAHNRLGQLHREKTGQYGSTADPFENVTASAKCGVEPWRRALCDLSDCVVRMQRYAQGQPVDYKNALLDAANWALICLIKLEESERQA